jgi:hypothetical protein
MPHDQLAAGHHRSNHLTPGAIMTLNIAVSKRKAHQLYGKVYAGAVREENLNDQARRRCVIYDALHCWEMRLMLRRRASLTVFGRCFSSRASAERRLRVTAKRR